MNFDTPLRMILVIVTAVSLSVFLASAGTPDAYGISKPGLIVPLYSYPGSDWSILAKEKADHPSVPIIAIINPDNGPGTKDANYVYGVQKLQSSGVKVIGYIYTANVGFDDITKCIDEYKDWYHLDGIFFDQMSYVKGDESLYANLSNYSRSVGLNFTVGNPGTDTLPSYVGTVDNMVIYDNPSLPNPSNFLGWHKNYTKSNFSFVSYGVQDINRTYVNNISKLVQYMYVTNYTSPNPFYSLPGYVDDIVRYLDEQKTENNTVYVNVAAYDHKGVSLPGFWTVVKSMTNSSSGFTPFSFDAVPGNNYTITVSNFDNYTFDHWDDGTKNNTRTIQPLQNMTISAYYATQTLHANATAVGNTTATSQPCDCVTESAAPNTGSVITTISYATGDRAYSYGVSLKIYQDTDQSAYREIGSISSNPFEVDALPLGHTYKFEVYANGMHSDVRYVRLDDAVKRLTLYLPSPGGVRSNVFYNDGVTPVPDAIVYVRDQQNNTWGMDYTDIRGHTLRFWLEPTMVNEDHYVLDVNIGKHLSYSYWPVFLYPGVSRDINIVTPWPPLVDRLITVKAYDGDSRLLSAKNSSFAVDLLDNNGNTVSESKINYHGEAHFSNLKVGDYAFCLVDVNGTRLSQSKVVIDGTTANFVLHESGIQLGD